MNWRNIINSAQESATSIRIILLILMIAMDFTKASIAAVMTAITTKKKRNLENSITKNSMISK